MTSFALRIPEHLMEQAKQVAKQDQVSVNQLFLSFIAEGLGHQRGLKMMRERAARADAAAALAVLDSVPVAVDVEER